MRELLKQNKRPDFDIQDVKFNFTKETSQYTAILGYENSQVAMYKSS